MANYIIICLVGGVRSMLMGVIGVRVTRSLSIGVLFFLMSPFGEVEGWV